MSENYIEWKRSEIWKEILNQVHPNKENEKEENYSNETAGITQNFIFEKLTKENNDLFPLTNIEKLLSSEQKISPRNEEIEYDSLKLIDFKNNLLDNLKEDLFYYCSTPKNLLNYKKIEFNEKKFEFYHDLEIENFIACQKERSDIILKYENVDNSEKQNLPKENNNDIFKQLLFLDKKEINEEQSEKLYLLNEKLSDYNSIELKEKNNKNLISYLKELKDVLSIQKKIGPSTCGIVCYNFIVNNIILILDIFINRFNDKVEELTEFIMILRDICCNIPSIQLKLFLLKILKENRNILKDKDINFKDEYKLFMEDYINFNEINKNNNNKIVYLDFKFFLYNHDFDEEIKDMNNINLNEQWTLNSGNNLFLFIKNPYELKFKEEQFLIYFKINLK